MIIKTKNRPFRYLIRATYEAACLRAESKSERFLFGLMAGKGVLMGTIYKRGNTYWLKYYRNGKPYYESTKSSKETEAKKLLRKREGEISEGKLPGIYFDFSLTLARV